MSKIWAILASIALSVITIGGDALIKQAALQKGWSGWQRMLLGSLIYGLSGFGWFFVMRRLKLSTVGVVYSLSMIIGLTVVGVVFFRERLLWPEAVGVTLGVTALVLMSRFA